MTGTIQVGPQAAATLIVAAGSGETLVVNNGPNDIFIGDDNAIRATDSTGIVDITPNSYFAVSGEDDLYACVIPNKSASVSLISGGLNFFTPPSLSGLGGIKLFVQATAPTQPPTIPLNSIWFNITPPVSLNYWNGAAWIAQAFAGNQIIQTGTIIANLMAAGIVVAGIVDGTLISTSPSNPSVQLDGSRDSFFVYDAASNLIVASSGVAGSDFFGHPYPQGISAFLTGTAFQLAVSGKGVGGFTISDIANPPNSQPQFYSDQSNALGCAADLTSGASTNVAIPSTLILKDSVFGATVNGHAEIDAGVIALGYSGFMVWNDNAGSLGLPVGGGPFISGESFHAISLGAGLTGTLRVKKVPWNGVWLDAQLTVTASGTINCGSLPDATYYPAQARNIPLAPTVAGSTAYIHLPTSGAVQVITSAATGNPGGSFVYPTN